MIKIEYKETECKSCKTMDISLFTRPNMRDEKDYYCKPCMDVKKHIN